MILGPLGPPENHHPAIILIITTDKSQHEAKKSQNRSSQVTKSINSKSQVTKSLSKGSFVSGIPARDHKQNLKLNALLNKLDSVMKKLKENI